MLRLVLALALVTFSVTDPAAAQTLPAVDSVNGHSFMSTPFVADEWTGGDIYYQACNSSGSASSFIWSGARWGVSAWKTLDHGFCAFKRVHGLEVADQPESTRVRIQGHPGKDIRTWIFSRSGEGRLSRATRIITEIIVPVEEAEGIVRADDISMIVAPEGGDSAAITIMSTGLDEIVIVLPGAADGTGPRDWSLERKRGESGFDQFASPEHALPDLPPEFVSDTPFAVQPGSLVFRLNRTGEASIADEFIITGLEGSSREIHLYGRRAEVTRILEIALVPEMRQ